VRNEPWGLATQLVADPKLRGARLRFTLSVRTEGASGNGGGPFLIVHGNAGVTVAHEQKLEQGTTAWKRVAIDFTMPAGAESFEVGAILEGPGKLWVDAARVDRLDPVGR
jgi:hypothetical protein